MSGDPEVIEGDDTQFAADFESGFSTEASPVTTAPTVEKPATEEAPKPEEKPETTTKPAEETPPAQTPKYVQITEEEWNSAKSAIGKMTDYDKRFRDFGGTLGGIQDVVKQLQKATPLGMSIEIPDDAFGEMAEEYPDIAKAMRSALGKALKNVRGTKLEDKPAEEKPSQQPTQEQLLGIIKQAIYEGQRESLEDEFPDWRDIVGAVKEGEAPNQEHPFRKWLASKEAAYQEKINNTNSAGVIARAIGLFKKETANPAPTPPPKKDPAPQAAARRDRIQDAVQPRGDGGPPVTPRKSTEDDAFNEGFNEG